MKKIILSLSLAYFSLFSVSFESETDGGVEISGGFDECYQFIDMGGRTIIVYRPSCNPEGSTTKDE